VQDEQTVQVTINLTRTSPGLYHWFVTTSQELQTVQWADDGTVESWNDAVRQSLAIASKELQHFVRGGSVTI
jgi:hypothetical protein